MPSAHEAVDMLFVTGKFGAVGEVDERVHMVGALGVGALSWDRQRETEQIWMAVAEDEHLVA